ncbi:uncharacterized protein LOC117815943 [Notolabrus celidotus]|uniref:uncharacterized protein LOC117815943 n=1 Tax=Notolabrus celidotus TaxID=1203425 RepID=UPI00148F638E|nr:uncharacterized protein LOC117815943 [Notolabrus celidotus]
MTSTEVMQQNTTWIQSGRHFLPIIHRTPPRDSKKAVYSDLPFSAQMTVRALVTVQTPAPVDVPDCSSRGRSGENSNTEVLSRGLEYYPDTQTPPPCGGAWLFLEEASGRKIRTTNRPPTLSDIARMLHFEAEDRRDEESKPECDRARSETLRDSFPEMERTKEVKVTESGPSSLRQIMWHRVLLHVRDQLSWSFGSCDHGPLDESSRDKPWMV